MLLDLVRESGLSAWVVEAISAEGSPDPTPALDRLRRYQEELAGALADHLRDLAVPPKAARKWLQITRGQADPPPGAVAEACQHLETFVRMVLPQVLHDARELRD